MANKSNREGKSSGKKERIAAIEGKADRSKAKKRESPSEIKRESPSEVTNDFYGLIPLQSLSFQASFLDGVARIWVAFSLLPLLHKKARIVLMFLLFTICIPYYSFSFLLKKKIKAW